MCLNVSTLLLCQRISPVIRAYHARVPCVSRPRYVRITSVIRWHKTQVKTEVYINKKRKHLQNCVKFIYFAIRKKIDLFMKKTICKIACVLLLGELITACGGQKGDSNAQEQDSINAASKGDTPYAESPQSNEYEAQLGGNTYKIAISRKADESLPVVADELGKKFYDNRVDVVITCNGNAFFSKSYTKASFSEFLTSTTDKQGTVLLGMAYDSEKSNSKAIHLGAQVGQVGIEEGPAFSIEIPLNGGASSIVRDTNQDTTGNDGLSD